MPSVPNRSSDVFITKKLYPKSVKKKNNFLST